MRSHRPSGLLATLMKKNFGAEVARKAGDYVY